MDEAIKALVMQHGLPGLMMALLLGGIIYLQKQRDKEGQDRLKEARETLTTIAEVNRMLGGLKEAVSGLATSHASLAATVQTLHSDSKSALEQTRQRDDRVERQIEVNSELIREIAGTAKATKESIDRLVAKSERDADRGR